MHLCKPIKIKYLGCFFPWSMYFQCKSSCLQNKNTYWHLFIDKKKYIFLLSYSFFSLYLFIALSYAVSSTLFVISLRGKVTIIVSVQTNKTRSLTNEDYPFFLFPQINRTHVSALVKNVPHYSSHIRTHCFITQSFFSVTSKNSIW